MALGRLDALQVADRVGGDGLVEHGLLHNAADNRANHPAGVGRKFGHLDLGAVRLPDDLACPLQAREEGVEVSGVALAQPQLAELGKST
jgi:hypothetical protein